jgi:putative ABC transport system permease protein
VQANGHGSKSVVNGIDIGGIELIGRTFTKGRSFDSGEVRRASSVCVITQSVQEDLFPRTDPIGRSIRIDGNPFVVTGIVADRNIARFDALSKLRDLQIFVPINSALLRLNRDLQLVVEIKTTNPEVVPQVQQAIWDLMELRRYGRRVDFQTLNAADAQQAYLDGAQTMAHLLAAVAGISLLVGGIGIMNIMLVSVTERTQEIGIRVAIGFRARDVTRQFLAESTTLSLFGGLLGVAVGLTASRELNRLYGWPTEMTLTSVLAALACCVCIGVMFGFYPARRAALMDPVAALRIG